MHNEQPFDVTVRMMTGLKLNISCRATDTVAQLKNQVARALECDDEVIVIYHGLILRDHCTLADYKLSQTGAVIVAMRKAVCRGAFPAKIDLFLDSNSARTTALSVLAKDLSDCDEFCARNDENDILIGWRQSGDSVEFANRTIVVSFTPTDLMHLANLKFLWPRMQTMSPIVKDGIIFTVRCNKTDDMMIHRSERSPFKFIRAVIEMFRDPFIPYEFVCCKCDISKHRVESAADQVPLHTTWTEPHATTSANDTSSVEILLARIALKFRLRWSPQTHKDFSKETRDTILFLFLVRSKGHQNVFQTPSRDLFFHLLGEIAWACCRSTLARN